MVDIVQFAIESARGQAEISRLAWADNDEIGRTGMVRDAKHPTSRDGNHKPGPSCNGNHEQASASFPTTPRASVPHSPKRVMCSALRTYTSTICGTMRPAACLSGVTPSTMVAQFTLHESWNELKRYTNLRPENLREIPSQANVVQFPSKRGRAETESTRPSAADDQSVQPDPPR